MDAVQNREIWDIVMYEINEQILSHFLHQNELILNVIFHGPETELMLFLITNSHHPFLKFTKEISNNVMTILGVNPCKEIDLQQMSSWTW
jgi:hypothetical protein